MKNKWLLGIAFLLSTTSLLSQKDFYQNYPFTAADTLRGALNADRSCFDVTFYDLNIKVDPEQQFITGYVDIVFEVLADFDKLQIDLYQNLYVEKILNEENKLTYNRNENIILIDLPNQKKGTKNQIRVYYSGNPIVAKTPPWDGGFVWSKDSNENHWIGVACEGAGASLWWPNKDHLSDEPDSMSIKIAVPNGLMCVSNGNLRASVPQPEAYTRYDWFVNYPINNYNVTVNIADYAHFTDTYMADDLTTLELDYYVLKENLLKAKKHFQQTKKVLACYERYFGKYPFWKDGFALVETPYLGMEHQSAIAYGNKYQKGYLGSGIPSYMDWDYIIVHETGHEYWGNSISANDHAEMWIHESFTTYMEALYVECAYSYEEALIYLEGQRFGIDNEEPILGPMDVNWQYWKGSDHYSKGSWMLHTLRHSINDDDLWFELLKSFYLKNQHSQVTTQQIITYVNEFTKYDYSAFFEQYLEYPSLPTLEYMLAKKGEDLKIKYRWKAAVPDFDMPILVGKKDELTRLIPTSDWQISTIPNLDKEAFYIPLELYLIEVEQF